MRPRATGSHVLACSRSSRRMSASHTNQSQSGPWWVATQCSPPGSHPNSRRSGRVRVQFDLAEDIFGCALSTDAAASVVVYLLSTAFHLSRFLATLIHVSLFFVSLSFISSVSSGLRNSLISSSHLFFGLPTGLYVWCLMLRPGSILPLSLPIVHLEATQLSLPNAISSFCVFQSGMGFWTLSSIQWVSLCFFSCIQSILPLQLQLRQSLHRCLP